MPSTRHHQLGPLVTDGTLRTSSSLQTAHRLLVREAAQAGGGDPIMVAAALERACARLADTLRDGLGDDGCSALFARALVRTEPRHRLLKDIRLLEEGGVHSDDLIESVKAHGEAAVIDAIEAFLGSLVDILVRLIGEDVAMRLIEPYVPQSRTGDGAQTS